MPTRIPLPFPHGFAAHSEHGSKGKSRLFTAIETALDTYAGQNTRANLLNLTDAIAAWKLSKGRNGAWTNSIRSPSVQLLGTWLIEESEALGIFPTSRRLWGQNHNCYAYSMLCERPRGLGQNSRPGKYAGTPQSRRQQFAQGVTEDATKDGKVVQILVNTADNVPAEFQDGTYLVAMVANDVGYHFMRRRETTGLWTHKNGAMSKVETFFYDLAQEKPVALTDAVVSNILRNPRLIECSMTFECFLKVPQSGLQVEG